MGWQPHLYRGWDLEWFRGAKSAGSSEIVSFEPLTSRFKLKLPREIKPGDRFEVYPRSANWNIHDNTISGCLKPVVLDSHGSHTSYLKDNVISRGEITGAKEAIQVVRGQFHLTGNQTADFGEAEIASPKDAKPLMSRPAPGGK